MAKLPEEVYVQIDDVDDKKLYLTAYENDNTGFPPGYNHPVGVYKLIKVL